MSLSGDTRLQHTNHGENNANTPSPEIGNSPVPFFIKPVTRGIASKVYDLYLTENFKRHFSFLNGQLETSPNSGDYLCGKELTGADILLSFPLMGARKGNKIDAEASSKLMAYIRRLEENETHVESIKKVEEMTGEKYQLF